MALGPRRRVPQKDKNMLQSESPIGDILTCPWCHLRQCSRMTRFCRRCRRPLPVVYLEVRIPSTLTKSDSPDADSLPHLIGKTLRRLRLRRGYTQSMLATVLGTHRTQVSRVENARVTASAAFVLRAAAALGVVRILICARTQETKQDRDPNRSDC